jgi:uncharacterized protein
MTAAPAPDPGRIALLDFVRGIAVMGILLANLPALGLPEAAYFSPLAWGGHEGADKAVWLATFVLVEGKLRGLFSLLFGASMLLVIDRATAAGRSAANVHFARMAVLFAIGCAHLYLIWWGDILSHYALVGSIAFLFAGLRVRWLVAFALAFALLDLLSSAAGALSLFGAAARDTPAHVAVWDGFATGFGVPPRADIVAEVDAYRGSFVGTIAWRWAHALSPFVAVGLFGAQTLAMMLLGMAAYRSGFLTGGWPRRAYIWIAATGLGVALPAYLALGLNTIAHGFDQRWVYLSSIVIASPLRLVATFAYAALCVLAFREHGALSARIAAAGRAAFTNYIGTSILMLLFFTGLGLFGALSRAQLYLIAPVVFAIMLAWSQPWLHRFEHGPLEWLWRSLARGAMQPMRRDIATNRTT